MPAYARREIVPSDEVGVYHCTARCVRRAFLCGVDPLTGNDYEHRKDWIDQRLEKLASVFAIDICSYAVMSNHIHLILRARPDLVKNWSDEETALRWKRLYPPRDPGTGRPAEPAECDLNMIISDTARVALIRERLSSLSWFMRCLCEPIAPGQSGGWVHRAILGRKISLAGVARRGRDPRLQRLCRSQSHPGRREGDARAIGTHVGLRANFGPCHVQQQTSPRTRRRAWSNCR